MIVILTGLNLFDGARDLLANLFNRGGAAAFAVNDALIERFRQLRHLFTKRVDEAGWVLRFKRGNAR